MYKKKTVKQNTKNIEIIPKKAGKQNRGIKTTEEAKKKNKNINFPNTVIKNTLNFKFTKKYLKYNIRDWLQDRQKYHPINHKKIDNSC